MKIHVKHTRGNHYCNLKALLQIYFASTFLMHRTFYVEFTENSIYDLGDEDQKDWNKIIGRGGLVVKKINGVWTRKYEQFVVWKWNIPSQRFFVGNYKREDYKMVAPKIYQRVELGTRIRIDVNWLYSLLPLGGYFGGNETAPRDLEYLIHVL